MTKKLGLFLLNVLHAICSLVSFMKSVQNKKRTGLLPHSQSEQQQNSGSVPDIRSRENLHEEHDTHWSTGLPTTASPSGIRILRRLQETLTDTFLQTSWKFSPDAQDLVSPCLYENRNHRSGLKVPNAAARKVAFP